MRGKAVPSRQNFVMFQVNHLGVVLVAVLVVVGNLHAAKRVKHNVGLCT